MGIRYCEINSDLCPNNVANIVENNIVFSAFSSHDELIVNNINNAISELNENTEVKWISWEKDLEIENEMIFCEICKSIYSSKAILIELSDLNFNVIFEYGFSIGINKKIHPIVNSNFDFKNIERFFDPLLGIGIGKYDKNRLAEKLQKKRFWEKQKQPNLYSFHLSDILSNNTNIETNQILYIKNADDIQTAESIESEFDRFSITIIYDKPEDGTFSLAWYAKQIKRSYAVIIDMGLSNTNDNFKHFLKCALVSGLSVGTGRRTLILNSSRSGKPSDIISIIKSYTTPKDARKYVNKFLNQHSNTFSAINAYIATLTSKRRTLFDDIDLGEHVAENDIQFLNTCFVKTAEYLQLIKPGYKIIIGRKGTGKTAAFLTFLKEDDAQKYIVINQFFDKYHLDDIYNLTKSFENDNDKHKIVNAFWKYVIFSIIAYHIYKKIENTNNYKEVDIEVNNNFIKFYRSLPFANSDITITESLVKIIDRIREKGVISVQDIQREFYQNDILTIRNEVLDYLTKRNEYLYLNIDGLDANISLRKNSHIISMILFNLHEICSTVSKKRIKNIAINLFIRTDLYDTFKNRITEKDKINKIFYQWNNETLLRLISLRLNQNNINHISEIMSEDLNTDIMMKKMDKYVYKRPRDYVYFFNTLIQLAQSQKTDKINSKIFNEALDYYSLHINESVEAELISMPFKIIPSELFNYIKHENNEKEKIPIEIFYKTLDYFNLDEEEKKVVLIFLLKNEILFIIENNKPIKWVQLVDPMSKLNIILSATKRIYLLFHPIVQILIERHY